MKEECDDKEKISQEFSLLFVFVHVAIANELVALCVLSSVMVSGAVVAFNVAVQLLVVLDTFILNSGDIDEVKYMVGFMVVRSLGIFV